MNVHWLETSYGKLDCFKLANGIISSVSEEPVGVVLVRNLSCCTTAKALLNPLELI